MKRTPMSLAGCCLVLAWLMTLAGGHLGGTRALAQEDPAVGRLEIWASESMTWEGVAEAANSDYDEGDVLPLRWVAELPAGSTHDLRISWDFVRDSSHHFFDALASYDTTETGVDPTLGVAAPGTMKSWVNRADRTLPVGAQQIPRFLTFGVGTALVGRVNTPGDTKTLQLRFTVESGVGPRTVIIVWGLQLASAADWGEDGGAASWPEAEGEATVQLNGGAVLSVAVSRDLFEPDPVPVLVTCPEPIEVVAEPDLCGARVDFEVTASGGETELTLESVPPSGSVFPVGITTVICTARDGAGGEATCSFTVTVHDAPNVVWPLARELALVDDGTVPGFRTAAARECLNETGQSRWYRFRVSPGSLLIVTLTDLPEDYDLVVFKDIAATYHELTTETDLGLLSAEFASDAFAPAQFSADAMSPAAFSPAAFSPAAFSPAQFSATVFAPAQFSPAAFSPAAFSPDAWAPAQFSPAQFSPAAFSPAQFSPAAFSPAQFSPAAFSAAQLQSVLGVSAFDGTTGEGLLLRTWDNTGDFYVRVRGRNGVFRPEAPFRLQVYLAPGSCDGLDLEPTTVLPPAAPATAGGYRTLILTDLSRLVDDGGLAALSARLVELAGRAEVLGAIVDVRADPRVAFFLDQAEARFECPTAKNLAAAAIKELIDAWWAVNPLENLVLVGGDAVIPFFRYPDEALLGPERNYVPPVRDATSSQASLRLNYFLGQDRYGARCALQRKTAVLPIPDLGVGRLVERPWEIAGMLEAYLETPEGVVPSPERALVTGYDFLTDAAEAIRDEVAAGLGSGGGVDTLIAPANLAPSDGWTADDLRGALFGARHDLVFLAGHFSAFSALAADFATVMVAAELEAAPVDFKNAILFSAGCHSGYNTVDTDGIPGVTPEPDWAQACARRQATLLAGTGYQYGDTDFIEYSERLYLEFTRLLRSGTGPVPLGRALAEAKRRYLATTPVLQPLHEKALLQATLFGLPMLSVDFPGDRLPPEADDSVIPGTLPAATPPGSVLNLSHADLEVVPEFNLNTVDLTDPEGTTTVTATYLQGRDGTVNNPTEPILPLEVRNITVPGLVARGVGFRGGQYVDLGPLLPLTSAAATEIRGVHSTFLSEVFFPVRPWSVNYFGGLCTDAGGGTRLMVVPAQFQVNDPATGLGTLRRHDALRLRLFYSDNLTTYVEDDVPSTPGLSAPPSLDEVEATEVAGGLRFSVRATGNPAAGIQEVWVTYTATAGPWYGQWQSLDLLQDGTDSTRWTGALPIPAGVEPGDVRYLVQAVNGVGLVGISTRGGAYHVPGWKDGWPSPEERTPTVSILTAPDRAAYGATVTFAASLTDEDGPRVGQVLRFSLGDQLALAVTDAEGRAQTDIKVVTLPGSFELKVTYSGAPGYRPASASAPVTIEPAATRLDLGPDSALRRYLNAPAVYAQLTDASGAPLVERSVLFILQGVGSVVVRTVITDFAGRAWLGAVGVPAGVYNLHAHFGEAVVLPGGGETIDLRDVAYGPSSDLVRISVRP